MLSKIFKPTSLAYIGLLVTTLIWGSTYVIIKDSLNSIDENVLNFFRFSLASFILASYLVFKKIPLNLKWRMGLVPGFLLFLVYYFQNLALSNTSATNSGFIASLFILFVPPLAALILKERITISQIALLFISLFGSYVLAGGIQELNWGDVFMMISSVAYAGYIVIISKQKRLDNPAIEAFQHFLIISLLSFVASVGSGVSFEVNSTQAYLAIIFLTLFASIFAFLVLNSTETLLKPFNSSLIISLQSVFGLGFAYLVGESIAAHQILGGAIIFSSIIGYQIYENYTTRNTKPILESR